MEYDRAARKRLGRAVRAARTAAGFSNRADFADKVKRSTRQVQALETGEDGVGPDTWAAVAEVLEWPIERVYEILDGSQESDRPPSTPALTGVSDEQLVAEVLRRLVERGEGDEPATTTKPSRKAGRPEVTEHLRGLPVAARDTGRAPRGQA